MSIDRYTGSPDINIYPLQPANAENSCFRFLDKGNNECERLVISNSFKEQINLYGTKCSYFLYAFNTSASDNFYGEDPIAHYIPPLDLIIMMNLNENAVMLTKMGFSSEDEVTFFIHISSFYEAFRTPALSSYFYGYSIEPKSGDVIQLTEYGLDRPGDRNGKMFEITERLDQDIAQINPLMGHYVWMLKAKRYESSFEPGLSGERGNQQVFDDIKRENIPNLDIAGKNYPYNVNDASKSVFDGSINSDVYGDYGS
jgi:hypothetical protein